MIELLESLSIPLSLKIETRERGMRKYRVVMAYESSSYARRYERKRFFHPQGCREVDCKEELEMRSCWCGAPATTIMRVSVSDNQYALHVAVCDEHEGGEVKVDRVATMASLT